MLCYVLLRDVISMVQIKCLHYLPFISNLARADLSGCWTDTPPITYEHGGAVLTVAINLNGKVRFYTLKK